MMQFTFVPFCNDKTQLNIWYKRGLLWSEVTCRRRCKTQNNTTLHIIIIVIILWFNANLYTKTYNAEQLWSTNGGVAEIPDFLHLEMNLFEPHWKIFCPSLVCGNWGANASFSFLGWFQYRRVVVLSVSLNSALVSTWVSYCFLAVLTYCFCLICHSVAI